MPAAGSQSAQRPIIGAEIWDDPTATQEKVDHWFKILADYQMPLARVFVPRGEQSLQRMDWFFRAAEKYHVGITATLGGTPSEENGQWIQAVVKRYKDSPALDSWILMNEPGAAPRMTDTALSRFRIWLREVSDGRCAKPSLGRKGTVHWFRSGRIQGAVPVQPLPTGMHSTGTC
jgi:hypothetical protein